MPPRFFIESWTLRPDTVIKSINLKRAKRKKISRDVIILDIYLRWNVTEAPSMQSWFIFQSLSAQPLFSNTTDFSTKKVFTDGLSSLRTRRTVKVHSERCRLALLILLPQDFWRQVQDDRLLPRRESLQVNLLQTSASSCSSVVEPIPQYQEVMGLNLKGILVLCLKQVFLWYAKRFPQKIGCLAVQLVS